MPSFSVNSMQARVLRLPAFDQRAGPGRRKKDEENDNSSYQRGYEDGQAAASTCGDNNEAQRGICMDELHASIMQIENTCRQEFLELLLRVVSEAAPALKRSSMMTALNDLLCKQVACQSVSIRLTMHPEKAQLFQGAAVENIEIAYDPSLSPHAIKAEWNDGGLLHNADELISELIKLLSVANDDLQKEILNEFK